MDPDQAPQLVAPQMTDAIQQGVEAAPAAHFDILQMFLQSSIVVQIVIVGLVLSSVVSWGIIIQKTILIARERSVAASFEQLFWSGKSLEIIEKTVATWRPSSMTKMFKSVLREWRLTTEGGAKLTSGGFRDRVQAIMDVEAQREMGRLESRLLYLATIGSAAPFIGLFGTVWGIMNSFTAIASSKDTNLAVVAPGIAEALFATALGLAAAIPAVIFYNKFSSDIARLGVRLEIFAREFWATISRQLDLRAPVSEGVEHGDDGDRERVGQTVR